MSTGKSQVVPPPAELIQRDVEALRIVARFYLKESTNVLSDPRDFPEHAVAMARRIADGTG